MKVGWPISPILTLKLIAVATSLQRSEKRVRAVIYDQSLLGLYGENLVKIGPVNPEIICLSDLFKKVRN